MKKNTKKYVKLSVILYVVILGAVLIGTLAWFVFEQNAEVATGNDSKIIAGEYLEIREVGEDEWGSKLEFNATVQYPDVSVTPDGTVWYPRSLNNDDTLTDNVSDFENVTVQDGYFVKLDLEVRATQGLDVYLHQNSSVSGVNMDKIDAANSFSKDAVAGAARVGFFEKGDGEALTLKTVWVPNENYELTSEEKTYEKETAEGETGEAATDTRTVYAFSTSGNPDASYQYVSISGESATTEEWDSEMLSIGKDALASGTAQDGLYINSATPLLTFDKAEQVKKLTVYVWVEGTDDESDTVLSGGSIKFNLEFVGIPTKAEAKDVEITYDAETNQLFYSDGKAVGVDEISYSTDKKEWISYNPEDHPGFEGDVLYVRTKETDTVKVGKVIEVNLK